LTVHCHVSLLHLLRLAYPFLFFVTCGCSAFESSHVRCCQLTTRRTTCARLSRGMLQGACFTL
jgi:hypothetical protein